MQNADAREEIVELATGVALVFAVAAFTALLHRVIVEMVPLFEAWRSAGPLS